MLAASCSVGFAHEKKKRLGHSLVWGLIDRFRGRSPRYGLVVGLGFNSNRYGLAACSFKGLVP